MLLRNVTLCCVTSPLRVRFLLGGRHGDFKFLPPAGYSPCYEALLPKEKMHVEPVKEYKRDHEGVRDLLGTTQFLSQASYIPTPVDTSQVRTGPSGKRCCCNSKCSLQEIFSGTVEWKHFLDICNDDKAISLSNSWRDFVGNHFQHLNLEEPTF